MDSLEKATLLNYGYGYGYPVSVLNFRGVYSEPIIWLGS